MKKLPVGIIGHNVINKHIYKDNKQSFDLKFNLDNLSLSILIILKKIIISKIITE